MANTKDYFETPLPWPPEGKSKMAKLRVFSARDSKLGVFMTPFYMQHLGQALRMWEDVCNQADSAPSKYPADFVLFELGIFDDDTAVFVPHNPMQLVSSALDMKRKPEGSLPLNLK